MLRPATLFACLFCSQLVLAAGPAYLYRYVDDRGTVVLDRHGVPPQYIGKGYEVLNEQGRVVDVVPPAPTAEEIQRLREKKVQAASDAKLLRLYASPDDVELAKKRRLAELDGMISVARGNLQSLRTQQGNLHSQAAEHERAGRKVPEELLTQLANLKAEQEGLQREIARHEQARAEASASFDADRNRLEILLGEFR